MEPVKDAFFPIRQIISATIPFVYVLLPVK